jgi:hypothetical protein
MNHDDLLEICHRHTLASGYDVVVAEPYIPYVPANWNKILVLAEAQNLSSTYSGYVESLKRKTPEEKFLRLMGNGGNLGIMPWDDHTLKLAIEAAFGTPAENTAVSNSVVWSQVDEQGRKNLNPGIELQNKSIEFWSELLPCVNLACVVACGKIAKGIMNEVHNRMTNAFRIYKLASPSGMLLSRMSYLFDTNDLLQRYPEVRQVADNHPEWLQKHRKNKIFFACHAVSTIKNA